MYGGAALDKDTAQGLYDFGFDVYPRLWAAQTSGAIAAENKYVRWKWVSRLKQGRRIIIRVIRVLGYYYKRSNKSAIDGWFHTGI